MAAPKNEVAYISTLIYINGTLKTDLQCTQIEDSVGMTPSRAVLVQTFGRDVTGPNSLIPQSGTNPYAYGMRVTIKPYRTPPGGTPVIDPPIFCGWLLKRSDQCAEDKVIWQALDDRVLLQWIAVRGCLVWDAIGKEVRYSPRHPMRMNPSGFWNCTGFTDSDYGSTVLPCFTNVAKRAYAYENPNASYDWTTLRAGQYNPWTPRRALMYLRYWAYYANKTGGVHPSLVAGTQSFLSGASDAPLVWTTNSIANMVGVDPGVPGGTDPLDRKIMDLTLQGGSLLSGIQRTLDVAGTHSLHILAQTDPAKVGQSVVEFPMTGYNYDGGGGGGLIKIQRSGYAGGASAGNEPNAWDFNFDEDASQLVESVLVEGDVAKAEASVDFVALERTGSQDYADLTSSDFIPAWNYAQEVAFLECLHGTTPSGSRTPYAKRARVSGDPTTLEVCDGSSDKPLIWSRDRGALEAARESFPWVYRAWRLNSRTTYMQSILGLPETVGESNPGGVKGARQVLPEQLQFMVRDLGGDGANAIQNWMLQSLPIRVRVRNADATEWHEVPKDLGARVDADGTFWIDALAESASGSDDCVFAGDLFSEQDYKDGKIVLRDLRLNIAFPSDYRVRSVQKSTNTSIDAAIRGAFKNAANSVDTWLGLSRYQDEGQSFMRHYQVNSEPSLSPKYYGGTSGTTEDEAPLSREIPPGSEAIHAQYAAQRTLARFVNPHRQASFRMIGIQTEWKAGVRINYVMVGSQYYYLRGCVGSVVHNFLTQQTSLGGLLAEYGSAT